MGSIFSSNQAEDSKWGPDVSCVDCTTDANNEMVHFASFQGDSRKQARQTRVDKVMESAQTELKWQEATKTVRDNKKVLTQAPLKPGKPAEDKDTLGWAEMLSVGGCGYCTESQEDAAVMASKRTHIKKSNAPARDKVVDSFEREAAWNKVTKTVSPSVVQTAPVDNGGHKKGWHSSTSNFNFSYWKKSQKSMSTTPDVEVSNAPIRVVDSSEKETAWKETRLRSAPADNSGHNRSWRGNLQNFNISFWKKSQKNDQCKDWSSERELQRGNSGPAEIQRNSSSWSFSGRGNKDKKEHRKKTRTIMGDEVVMLYSYAANPGEPFLGDGRGEINANKGQKFDVLDMRPDGWCIVRKPTGSKEYWLPGNYLSKDGFSPLPPPSCPLYLRCFVGLRFIGDGRLIEEELRLWEKKPRGGGGEGGVEEVGAGGEGLDVGKRGRGAGAQKRIGLMAGFGTAGVRPYWKPH